MAGDPRTETRDERVRTVATLTVGASIPLTMDQLFELFLMMTDPLDRARLEDYALTGFLLFAALLMGLVGFYVMRTGKLPHISVVGLAFVVLLLLLVL